MARARQQPVTPMLHHKITFITFFGRDGNGKRQESGVARNFFFAANYNESREEEEHDERHDAWIAVF